MLCTDVIFGHVLPKSSIDTRLAFRIPPRKLDMAAFEDTLAGLAWKHGTLSAAPNGYAQFIPLWQYGMSDGLNPNQYIYIWLLTDVRGHPGSMSYSVHRYGETVGDFHKVMVHPFTGILGQSKTP